MPTNDAPAPPPRPPRRSLGRGPGTAPPTAGPDRPTAPPPQRHDAQPPAPDAPAPQTAPQSPSPPPEPAAPTPAAGEPRDDAPAAPEAPSEPVAEPEPVAVPEAVAEPEQMVPEPTAVEPMVPEATGAEPEPVHARADLDVAPTAGGHGGEAAGGGKDAGDGTEETGDGTGDGTEEAGDGAGAGEAGDGGDQGGQARGEPQGDDGGRRFTVRLDNFEGPFDLLLQLISKHKLDVTEVALSKVTDEFMAHIRAMGPDWDLDQTTEFLVVAATLLDLKAARLLPAAEVEDEADLALLEARDLLFARLLQYRAYKRIADIFNDRLVAEAARHPRTVGLEPHHAELLPDVVISIGPEGFAKLAVKAMQPKPKPQVYVDHIHTPLVSVREQAEVVVARLRELGEATFATLTEDAADVLTVVARFLALLELYRERAVLLDQPEALGSLTVRWTGEAGQEPLVTDEFDQETTAPKETAAPQKEKEEVPS
ncbi:segregation/condensation protein A [Streptomyces samsunensis]|uniref:Segregation and condensation protein A n=1 Tax=Streptomyces malaysiensis subsp. samsunensis TaxID=459658 RepID=A0A9X2M0H6_STRMQ|nr:segregation/condensation protein A [Streptomyces samsunensis]MCQ8832866.1 segregation/condensation protein A [Streptomyces samsunensis]